MYVCSDGEVSVENVEPSEITVGKAVSVQLSVCVIPCNKGTKHRMVLKLRAILITSSEAYEVSLYWLVCVFYDTTLTRLKDALYSISDLEDTDNEPVVVGMKRRAGFDDMNGDRTAKRARTVDEISDRIRHMSTSS